MKKNYSIYRQTGMALFILVFALSLTVPLRVSGQMQNSTAIEAVSVFKAQDPFMLTKPVLQVYGSDLAESESYGLGPLTTADRQFIESKVDPPCVGVVRDLANPIVFMVNESDIPATGSASVSGGRLTRIDADRVAWTIRIESAGADQLRLFFSEGNFPPGVEVNIFSSEDYAFRQFDLHGTIGPYGFYTTTTFADHLILQFVIPVGEIEEMNFRIPSVVHSEEQYINRAPLTCYEDANCAYANGYADIEGLQNSVAIIFFVESGGNYQCTGGLMNDIRAGDLQPFFLTANHCFATQAAASTVEAQFDYETVSCGGAVNTNLVIVNGSNLIAQNSQTDFTLVLLKEQPGGARTYLGWSPNAVPNNETVHSVHHPSALSQKYSRLQNKTSPAYTCDSRSLSNFHYTTFLGGQAWHGSSGSPLVTVGNIVVGQMLGPCGDDTDICDFSEYYLNWGRFDKSYANNNLQYWLYGGGSSVSMSSSPSSSHNFGTINVGNYGTLYLTVTNTGTVPNYLNLDAGAISISGTNSGDFTIVGTTSLYLPPATSGIFTIRFYPSSPGMKTATLSIPHNADNIISPRVITLTGYGNPCTDIISLGGGGVANAMTFDVTGTGSWFTTTDNACGVTSEGVEQVYSFVAPASGTYKIRVTGSNGTNVCYMWRSGSCSSTGWNCISTIYAAGTYGSMNWTAGTTYYLLLDDQFTSTTTHTFYLYYEPCESITTLSGIGSSYAVTYPGGGNGIWYNSSASACGFYCFGREQVYQYTATVTGLYNIVVTASSGYVDYLYSTTCSESGWTCIDDIISTGTYGSFLFTEGTTYYFLLDDENTTAGAHTFYLNLEAAAGTWLGTVSTDWSNPANWSASVVPDATIDVTIPGGTPYSPFILSGTTASTESLTIQTGAVLNQNSISYLHVYGDFNSDFGQFIMNGVDAYLYFNGATSTYWDDDNENDTYTDVRVEKSLSTAELMMYQDMTCTGTFEVREGVFSINSVWTLNVNNISNTAFQVESGGKLLLNDESIKCQGGIVFYSGSQAEVNGGVIECGGNFTNNANAAYDIQFTGGTVTMKGSNTTYLDDLDGGTLAFYNLTVDKPAGTCYIKSANLTVNGTLTINSGTLSCNNGPAPTAVYNITVGASWYDNAGSTGFEESTGTVTFTGSTLQYCTNETFNNLVLNKPTSYLRISNTGVTCAHYDFTAGGIQVLYGGTFTAQDLVDNGIFGNYYLYSGGTINLSNYDGFIDLHGFLFIYGGNFNVWGGGGSDSYWPYMDNAGITMSDGVLDFKNYGVYVSSNMTYTLNDNITGGTIRTAGSFSSARSDFNPTGGTVELYGPSDCIFYANNGSNVFNVLVNKGAYDNAPGEGTLNRDRETGQVSYAPLANTVTIASAADINGNVTIQNGIVSAGTQTLTVAGNWNNLAGTAGFVEGTSTVEFDGANAADILSAETFYNLNLNKTYVGFEGLEVMQNLACGGNMHLIDGTLEVNNPANVDVSGNIIIDLNACLNVNDYTGLQVSVGGNWTNLNTTRTTTEGFYYGTSVVTFDGTADQILTTAATDEMFYNLTINKSTGEFKPNDNILCYGDVNISNGIWEDNVFNLYHTLHGDFIVQAAGGFYNAYPHNTVEFTGNLSAQITYLGLGGSFFNMVINKSTGISVTQTSDVRSWYDGDVTVENGICNLNGHQLLLTGYLNVNADGVLQLPSASTLIMTDNRDINVNSGGRIEAYGTQANPVTFRANVGTYRYPFNINSGGTLAAEYCIFKNMGANGVYLAPGSTVDPAHALYACTFQDGASGGTMLGINNSQVLTIRHAVFPTNSWGGASNVAKTLNFGHVYFVDFSGGFSGEGFDGDGFGLIDWVPTLTATATATVNPICAGSSSQLNVNRAGGLGPFTYLWSPATGLSNPNIINPLATPAVTTTYSVTVTDNLGTTATGSITVNVNPILPVSGSISASANPSPPGNWVTFTATPVNGGWTPAFQWKVNGVNVGTGLPTYSYIPSYHDQVSCVITSSYACPSGNPATSNTILMIVVPANTTVIGTIPSPLNLCFDASNTITVAGAAGPFTVQAGATATMIAGVKISYLYGTTVQAGGYLHGYITTTNSYCGSATPSMVTVIAGEQEILPEFEQAPGRFVLFPNPTTGPFTLLNRSGSDQGRVDVEMFDLRGERKMQTSYSGARSHDFELRDLPPGLYLLKVVTGGQVESFKLILTR